MKNLDPATQSAIIKAVMPLVASFILAFIFAKIVGGSVAFYFLIFAGISALIFLRDKPAEEEDDDDAYVEEYVETYDEEDTQPQEPQADMYDDNRNGQ